MSSFLYGPLGSANAASTSILATALTLGCTKRNFALLSFARCQAPSVHNHNAPSSLPNVVLRPERLALTKTYVRSLQSQRGSRITLEP